MFFLLPHLKNIGDLSTVSLSKSVGNNTLLFSGKSDNINELDYLKSQMCMQCTLLNIKQHKCIEVIDTLNGGTYYQGNKFMFCLLPRKESIGFTRMLNVIDCLHLIKKKNLLYIQMAERNTVRSLRAIIATILILE